MALVIAAVVPGLRIALTVARQDCSAMGFETYSSLVRPSTGWRMA